MTFIITLISLVIERFFHWSHLRHWRWFGKYQNMLVGRISNWPSYALIIVCILPLLLVVGVLNHFLGYWFYGAFKLVFGVVILLYCMGPDNLWLQTFSCLSELHKDDPKMVVDRAQTCFGIATPENSQAFHQAFAKAIFIEANQRVFAVVFWFLILGPIGAVLYRAITLCAAPSDLGLQQTAIKMQQVLDWIPVRVFTFIFALAGHFTNVFSYWKTEVKTGLDGNNQILTDCGIAALDVKKGNQLPEDGSTQKLALELLDRAFILWLVILAVVTLAAK